MAILIPYLVAACSRSVPPSPKYLFWMMLIVFSARLLPYFLMQSASATHDASVHFVESRWRSSIFELGSRAMIAATPSSNSFYTDHRVHI